MVPQKRQSIQMEMVLGIKRKRVRLSLLVGAHVSTDVPWRRGLCWGGVSRGEELSGDAV